MSKATYIFTREVKSWGVEAGDYYNPQRHMYQGGTEKLLEEGVIEEEHECCDGECNHDDCCGKIPENCPLN